MQTIKGHEDSIYRYKQVGDKFELFRGYQSYRLFGSMDALTAGVERLVDAENATITKKCMCCRVEFESWGKGNRMCYKCRTIT